MFTQQTDVRIDALSENQLIEKIRAWFGGVAPASPVGIGDDCAVVDPLPQGQKQLLTTDSLTYGQHFDSTASPRDAGAKLVNRNLSDIAAMGGEPGPALLNLLCGSDLSIRWLEEFIAGMRESCEAYGVSIVGGDVSQLEAGRFTASLSLTGTVTQSAVLRSSAAIGDNILVTGTLGGSILKKHLRFEPRIKEGQWLAAQKNCTSMMDLTDGLGKDLAALLPDRSSAAIDLEALPLSEDARECARRDGKSPEAHVFCDGEDYELLFTVEGGSDLASFQSEWEKQFPGLKLSCIGQIENRHANGLYIDASNGTALPWQSGFEHFKKS